MLTNARARGGSARWMNGALRAAIAVLALQWACSPGGSADAGGDAPVATRDAAPDGDSAAPVDAPADVPAEAPVDVAIADSQPDAAPSPCGAGGALCGDRCTTLTDDPAHCGSCGTACAVGQFCSGGGCREICYEREAFCGSPCNNVGADPANCGA